LPATKKEDREGTRRDWFNQLNTERIEEGGEGATAENTILGERRDSHLSEDEVKQTQREPKKEGDDQEGGGRDRVHATSTSSRDDMSRKIEGEDCAPGCLLNKSSLD